MRLTRIVMLAVSLILASFPLPMARAQQKAAPKQTTGIGRFIVTTSPGPATRH
jgi:hypothetical protein